MIESNLLFVHIPKTAGTSVTKTFQENILYKNKFATSPFPKRKHVTLVEYGDCNDISNLFKFTVVRNPFTRVYSHYRQYQNKNGYVKNFEFFLQFVNSNRKILEEKVDQRPCKFIEQELSFIQDLHRNGLIKLTTDEKRKTIQNSSPFVFFNQCYYIKNRHGDIQMDKIYKFENLCELEDDFNIKLIKINVNNGNYTEKDYYEDYTQTNIDLVRYIYSEDFINFGYSTDFS